MHEWFAGLEERERVTLVGGGAVAILFALFVFVLRPLSLNTAALEEEVALKETLRVDLARAEGVGSGVAARSPVPTDSSLYGIASSAATQHAIALGTIRTDGADALRVQFTDVPFDALAAWLVTLSNQHSVRVEQFIGNGRERGMVTGQVVLRRS